MNRVLPEDLDDPYFSRWQQIQRNHLDDIEQSFADVPVLRLRLFDEEMVGVERLARLADELYGSADPAAVYRGKRPFRVVEEPGEVSLELAMPLAAKGELDVMRDGHELYVTVGGYRRSFVLPDSLHRREVVGAALESGVLRVRFREKG